MQHESVNAQPSEKEPRAYIIWDTCEVIKHHAEYLREEDDTLSEDEAWNRASQDDFLFEHEWEYLIDALEEKMKEINEDGYWLVRVENFGWRSLDGYQKFQTTDAKEFLRKVLPDTDCTFHIFVSDDAQSGGKMLSIRNWHHDSPMGNEWYYARPISEASFYDEEEEDEED